jgi:hypothetical protein
MGEIYQIITKHTKWPQNVSNGSKITNEMSIKNYQHLTLQDTPKITQSSIFGLKIYHLAALAKIRSLVSTGNSDFYGYGDQGQGDQMSL